MAISTSHTAAQLNALGFSYPMIPGSPNGSTINTTYGIQAYPTVILIAPNRNIVEQDIWPISNQILRTKIQNAGGVPQSCSSTDLADEAVISTLQVFPNPVTDMMYFSTTEEMFVEIYDVAGRKVDSFNISDDFVYNCEHLQSGMYVVKAKNTDGKLVSVRKIIKN